MGIESTVQKLQLENVNNHRICKGTWKRENAKTTREKSTLDYAKH